MFQNPDFQQILQMLREIKTIAVVGLSPKASRPSYRVALGMQQRGYRIIPVRPALDEVLGEKAYPDLAALPGPVTSSTYSARPSMSMRSSTNAFGSASSACGCRTG